MHHKLLQEYQDQLVLPAHLLDVKQMWRASNQVFFLGNGGSASIANHCAVDLTNTGQVIGRSFTNPAMITCLANDFGWRYWMVEAVKRQCLPGDSLVLISASGESEDVIHVAYWAHELNVPFVSLTGFDAENPLRKRTQYSECIDLWVNSHRYNVVEMIHHIWLLLIIDGIQDAK